MNFKTFVFMILTFRRVDPIPKNIGLMLSITFWDSTNGQIKQNRESSKQVC